MVKLVGVVLTAILFTGIISPVFAADLAKPGIFDFFQRIFNLFEQKNEPTADNFLLPDLGILEPQELYITSGPETKKIRFSTTVLNHGKGVIEFRGKSDLQRKVTKATQVIQQKDGTNFYQEIGEFVFHPDHDHWHIGDFSEFQLWSIKDNGDFDRILAATDKMSFCLWDEHPLDGEKQEEDRQYQPTCESETQGISPGWADTYSATLEGQELDISSIQDGRYAIQAIINLDKKIMEASYTNNNVIIYAEIEGSAIRVIKNP